MGTRSLTIVQDEQGEEQVVMYRQYDGYPSGHGKELRDFVKDFTVVSGFNSEMPSPLANGAGCLAAQVVAHFKDGVGNVYLYPSGARDCGEEWIYHVIAIPNKPVKLIVIDVWKDNKTFFSGLAKDFDATDPDYDE